MCSLNAGSAVGVIGSSSSCAIPCKKTLRQGSPHVHSKAQTPDAHFTDSMKSALVAVQGTFKFLTSTNNINWCAPSLCVLHLPYVKEGFCSPVFTFYPNGYRHSKRPLAHHSLVVPLVRVKASNSSSIKHSTLRLSHATLTATRQPSSHPSV